MSFLNLIILIFLTFTTSVSMAGPSCTEEEFVQTISKGLPEGSASIIRRITQCNHWSGEIGDTSTERTKQIEEGLKNAKCDTLPKDQAAFIKIHSKLKKVKDAFSKAEAWAGDCD